MKYGIVLVALLFAGCGDAASEQSTVRSPLVLSDAQGPYLAFAHSTAGWQWVSRPLDADRTVEQPLWGEIAKEFRDAQFQSGALNFSASAAGSSSFSASIPGYGFGTDLAKNIDFSAETSGSTSFDPALGYGFGGQCNLAVFCDVAARACATENGCNVSDISECYSAVASRDLPAELGPYVCVIADYLSCALTSQGDQDLTCLNTLAGYGVIIEQDRPKSGF